MAFNLWFIVAGVLFVVMALSVTALRRLPLTTSILYLTVGVALGPAAMGILKLDPLEESRLVERVAEVAVIISLFTAGLKLRLPFRDDRWRLTLRLAFASMTLTVGLITAAGVYGLDLSLGAAVLLGGVLAPTDPVLASDVQAEDPWDKDRLRFSLTGEAGLNDGTAFPFVMLGLGLLGLHELGLYGWRWVAVDVVWAVVGGLGVGWAMGTLVSRYVLHLA
jgi:sodium/hydrogen antiporter